MGRVLSAYADVLRRPGAAAFSAAALLARLPMSTLALGIVLLVSLERGSYLGAGAVAAGWTLPQALLSPWLGRLVDRRGQARVMWPLLAVHVSGVVALVAVVLAGLPLVVATGCAALAGLGFGAPGSLARARWSHLLGDSPRLHTAFSLESVLDEVLFITGPVLVTLLAVEVHPAAGVLLALAGTAVGYPLLLLQRGSEPPAGPGGGGRHAGSVWALPGVRVLVVTFGLLGAVFGSVDLSTVALTAALGRPTAAGPVLAVFAVASLLAGVVFGAVSWRRPPGDLLVAGTAVFGAGAVLTTLAGSPVALAGALLVTGAGISPVMISG
ncbi:MFS transporter, partial [Kineococcus glutinatus]|uniref:MFS transporter n=1 Tax=Kineococcus glutinatus TaxID=1070872 RepID=UPI0031E51CA2